MVTELENVRKRLDKVNHQIVDLLSQRTRLVDEVADIKSRHNIVAYQPDRYQAMLQELLIYANSKGVSQELVTQIFEAIHTQSIRQQEQG